MSRIRSILLTSFVLVLPSSCSRENPEYDLGFEEGCQIGKDDAYSCKAKNPKIGTLDEKESEYAQGFFDGYSDCYEASTILSTCEEWKEQSRDSGY